MYRMEIISNKSVQEEIQESLEETIPSILYTIIPEVYGRGGDDRKLGTTTWPETNFMLISYIDDVYVEGAKAVLKAVKAKFPTEGIKCFIGKVEEA